MLGIYKSSDNGSTFTQCNNGLTSAWFNAFAICQGNFLAGSGEEGIFISSNVGSSWSSVNNGLGSLNIISLESGDENIFAGTSDAGIYISQDLGLNWAGINNGLDSDYITTIQFDIESELLLIGTKGEGVFVSSDYGSNWYSSSNGLPPNSHIRAMHLFDDKILISTNSGEVYISYDQSENWVNITENLMGSPVLSIYVLDDYIYAGLNAGGVWKYPISELVDAVDQDLISKTFVFMQNYPNPFNPETTITFSIPEDSNINLSIYNIKGQKVKTLIKNNIERGSHSIIWKGLNDSGNFDSSGVYFYKLAVDGKTEAVKKCLMLK